jgi:hypothetical protein
MALLPSVSKLVPEVGVMWKKKRSVESKGKDLGPEEVMVGLGESVWREMKKSSTADALMSGLPKSADMTLGGENEEAEGPGSSRIASGESSLRECRLRLDLLGACLPIPFDLIFFRI